MEKISNTQQLKALIRLSAESAKEEIDKINLRKIEEYLPDQDFNDVFSHINTLYEMQKTILMSISELMESNPENKPEINIEEIFDNENTLFRLFYMINDYLYRWRLQYKYKSL